MKKSQLSLEWLEDRTVPYSLSPYSWSSTHVSVSYVPDGATAEGSTSELFATLDAIAPTATWQAEFERAVGDWADASALDAYFVSDNGSPTGTSGSYQGDTRFGDIRLAAVPLTGYVAYAYYPNPSGGTLAGDIFLNSDHPNFHIGSPTDLYSVFLHELGHAFGLEHSDVTTAVMYAFGAGSVFTSLTADDIAGIQAIYGAQPQPDLFEPNDTQATAHDFGTVTSVNQSANLHSVTDSDWYKMTAKRAASYQFHATAGLTVTVYDSLGNVLGSGSTVTLSLAKNQPVWFVITGGIEAEYILTAGIVH